MTGSVEAEACVMGSYIRILVSKYYDVASDPEKRRRCLDTVFRPLKIYKCIIGFIDRRKSARGI